MDWRTGGRTVLRRHLAEPRGSTSRRRYRWSQGSIVDFWDESLTADTPPGLILDDDLAFLAAPAAAAVSGCDVPAHSAADQDAIIWAGSSGTRRRRWAGNRENRLSKLHRAAHSAVCRSAPERTSGCWWWVRTGRTRRGCGRRSARSASRGVLTHRRDPVPETPGRFVESDPRCRAAEVVGGDGRRHRAGGAVLAEDPHVR